MMRMVSFLPCPLIILLNGVSDNRDQAVSRPMPSAPKKAKNCVNHVASAGQPAASRKKGMISSPVMLNYLTVMQPNPV
jgi:hypothetical protein